MQRSDLINLLPSIFTTRPREGLCPVVRSRRQAAALQGGLRPKSTNSSIGFHPRHDPKSQ
jgi:hypothetical protein